MSIMSFPLPELTKPWLRPIDIAHLCGASVHSIAQWSRLGLLSCSAKAEVPYARSAYSLSDAIAASCIWWLSNEGAHSVSTAAAIGQVIANREVHLSANIESQSESCEWLWCRVSGRVDQRESLRLSAWHFSTSSTLIEDLKSVRANGVSLFAIDCNAIRSRFVSAYAETGLAARFAAAPATDYGAMHSDDNRSFVGT